MTNNAINNLSYYPANVLSDPIYLLPNSLNIIPPDSSKYYTLPLYCNRGDIIYFEIESTTSGSAGARILQNAGQSMIVPKYSTGTFKETTVGTSGYVRFQGSSNGTEYILVCIEDNTRFLFISRDGKGLMDNALIV